NRRSSHLMPPNSAPDPPSATAIPVPPGQMDVYDALVSFVGSSREYAALLLASTFSSGMLAQGIVFTYPGKEADPEIHSAIPAVSAQTFPSWVTEVLPTLSAAPDDGRTRILAPKTRPPEGPGRGIKPLDRDEPVFFAFELATGQTANLPAFLLTVEMTAALWRAYRRRMLGASEGDGLLAPALAVLSVVNASARFPRFAMSLCNEIASRFGCDRVSLGFLKGRYVRLAAMSHTEKFGKGMELIQAVEAAMEECLDQDTEIIFPAPVGSTGIERAAAELSRRFDSASVVSIPIRNGDRPEAVITLERGTPEPPDARDIRLLRLLADLVAPRLLDLRRRDRWFGARLAGWTREKLALVVGEKHTWAKLGAVACLAVAAVLAVARGEYRVEATFVTRPVEQRVVAAPYDGFLAAAHIRPGELVEANTTLLAELETAENRARLAQKQAEAASHQKDAGLARRENRFAEAQAAEARAEQAEAECDILRQKLEQAAVVSPLSGVVLSGDWVTRVGAPVKLGETLFEVAPLARMEADLYVPEEEIADIIAGQGGELAAAGRPDEKIPFRVLRITPMAELVKQKNVFRVQAELVDPPAWMLPGLEGVAKIDVEERLLVHIWTRRAVNWVKTKLWLWWWW
ncbi:MAG: HlyD family efflux transporter periplasmic adaptor subunit, partial [Planctomycetes bacterium]|nr:HlyD family efflux transporter periplasmic adaptor subunit [Planctomycetota bacterium]